MMIDFTLALSPHNIYLRHFHSVSVSSLISHEKLARLCFVDYNHEMALVAVTEDPVTGKQEIIGHGQLTELPGRDESEFALQVRDEDQGMGLGTEMLRILLTNRTRRRPGTRRRGNHAGELRHAPRLHQTRLRIRAHPREPELQG